MADINFESYIKSGLYECPVCGKTFYPTNSKEWVYRAKFGGVVKLVCSYGCKNKATPSKRNPLRGEYYCTRARLKKNDTTGSIKQT